MVKMCRWGQLWGKRCGKKGDLNIRRYNTMYTVQHFICNRHKDEYVRILNRNIWEYEFLDIKSKHICGLILCKECLNNVREIISY